MSQKNFNYNLNSNDLHLLVRKAINDSNKRAVSQNFNPKKYLEGKINPFICNHEVFFNNDDSLHVCAICGFSLLCNGKIPNSVEFTSFNYETQQFIKSILKLISYQYLEKEQIDLVNIFRQLEPNINQFLAILSKNKKRTINKNNVLLKEIDLKFDSNKPEVILKYESLITSKDGPKKKKQRFL